MDNFNYREFIYGQSLFNSKEDDKQQLNENKTFDCNTSIKYRVQTVELGSSSSI